MLIIASACYLYIAVCVAGALFDNDKSLVGLLFLLFVSLIWPIFLSGLTIYKLTKFLNRLP